MDVKILEKGLIQQLGAIEGFLKTILLKKISVEVTATSIADPDMVIEALKTGTAIIATKDDSFEVDVYIAYDDNWIPQLSLAMLGVEEAEINEITRDLVKEFSSQLFGTVQVSLQNSNIPTNPGAVELLKSGQVASNVSSDSYFMAQVTVTGKFSIDGDEQPQMAMIVALGIPDEDKINELLVEEEPEPEPQPALKRKTPQQRQAQRAKRIVEEEPVSDDDIDDLFGDEPEVPSTKRLKKDHNKERQKSKSLSPVTGTPVEFEELSPLSDVKSETEIRNLDILKDVELDISVELGRKELPLGQVLHLMRGSVIELDKLAGEPVEIFANGHRIAEGEVVVIDEHFGVRITSLVSTRERIESLRS